MVWAASLSLGFALLYLLTLAPTVLWGDDAYFQRVALTGELRPDGGGHWLWLQLAGLFVRLPWGDIAFRSNLLSAVAAVATLLVVFFAARQAGLRRDAAAVAVVSLGIGHTFWMHAVRAEVYTVFTVFVAINFWLWAKWMVTEMPSESESKANPIALYAGAGLFGVALLAHQMALFLLPSWAFLVWRRRQTLHWTHAAAAALFFLVGLIPFAAIMQVQIVERVGVALPLALRLYFMRAGADFGPAFFNVSALTLPRAIAMGLMLTVLQFAGTALFLIILGIVSRVRIRGSAFWASLFVFYIVDAFFAATYGVNDSYVFFLPGYLALALFAGAGWQDAPYLLARWRRRRPDSAASRKALAGALVLLVIVPVSAYYVAPRVATALDVNLLQARTLPGREPNTYFLWPGKRGYLGALRYGEETLNMLPEWATLIADHTPIQTLKYLQEVTGMRRDVNLVSIEPGDDLAPIIARASPGSPIFLADSNPTYYNVRSVPGATIAAQGPIYRLDLPVD